MTDSGTMPQVIPLQCCGTHNTNFVANVVLLRFALPGSVSLCVAMSDCPLGALPLWNGNWGNPSSLTLL